MTAEDILEAFNRLDYCPRMIRINPYDGYSGYQLHPTYQMFGFSLTSHEEFERQIKLPSVCVYKVYGLWRDKYIIEVNDKAIEDPNKIGKKIYERCEA